ncbi:MAG TPA: PHP domain-containing protein [Polyangiales bacterium]|nr:PHP domain-containing protein [Polyangiales bacterium]
MHDPDYVALALEEIASLLELSGEAHKARAYARGAQLVFALGPELAALVRDGRLTEVEGIGPSLSRQITELWTTGSSSLLTRLHATYPEGSAELASLPGVTRRRLQVLRDELGVHSVAALREACLAQRVRGLRGFGEKTERRLLDAIVARENAPLEPKRMLLADALSLTSRVQRRLVGYGDAQQLYLAGAARRAQEILTQLDWVVIGGQREACWERLTRSTLVVRVDRERASAQTPEGVPIQIHFAEPERAGAALLAATGSVEHFAALVARAQGCGYALDASGLQTRDGVRASADEASIYRELGLDYVPPEQRWGTRLPAAGSGELDELVRSGDVRGMVHCHTLYSDGKHSIEEMARAAEALGMDYITITDHSPSAHYAGGVELDRLERQWDEIAEVQERVKIRILRGTESDILIDGALDYPDAVLARFDVIIASIHGRFKLDRAQMTERLVRAMRSPVFKIWGHALGRLLLQREPFDCDVPLVLEALADSRGAIELNGDPYRLDLPPEWIPAARALHIPFVLSVDAHSTAGFGALQFAVSMARRGGLQRSEVLNTLPVAGFLERVRPLNA